MTRASSQDKDVSASPMTRNTRRSVTNDSDTDEGTPVRASRKVRKSIIAPPVIDLIEEENEEEGKNSTKNESEMNESSTQILDDLELRNRSISKSPNTNGSPNKKSVNNSLKEAQEAEDEEIGFIDDSVVEEPQVRKFFKSKLTSESTNSPKQLDDSDCIKNSSPIGKFENKRPFQQPQKASCDEIFKKLAKKKSEEISQLFDESSQYIETDTEQVASLVKKIDEALANSPTKTPVQKRRSIHETMSDSSMTSRAGTSSGSEDVSQVKETPKNSKKTEKTPLNTPSRAVSILTPAPEKTPLAKPQSNIQKTPKNTPSKGVTSKDLASEIIETPKSSKKAEKTPKHTPAKSPNVQDEVEKLMEDFVPDNTTIGKGSKTPNKKTPSKLETTRGDETLFFKEMDISQLNNSDMDIATTPDLASSTSTNAKADTKLAKLPVVETSGDSPTKNQNGTLSLASYIAKIPSLKRKSDGDVLKQSKTPEKQLLSRSWSQSVSNNTGETIDKLSVQQEKIVKSSKVTSPDKIKEVSSDESEDEEFEESQTFFDDEAEVASTDSITESERQYLKENEVPEQGESIGSQDSDEIDSGEGEDEGEGSDEDENSFIDDNEVSDNYSMDSDEKQLEESPKKKKMNPRIVIQSDSSEDEDEVAKEKLSQSRSLITAESEKTIENEAIVEESSKEQPASSKKKNLKRKREEEVDANESISVKNKRAKISEAPPNDNNLTGVGALFEEDSSEDEDGDAEEVKKKPVKPIKSASSIDIESVMNKCNELMGIFNETKKIKAALKREKKAQKLAKKKQEEVPTPKPEGLNSSNDSNKENILKKKKKPKVKKQKLVEGKLIILLVFKIININFFPDMPEKREDIASAITKLQEKMERKRQRKLERKLAKEQQEKAENTAAEGVEITGEEPKKREKKSKVSNSYFFIPIQTMT